MAKSLAFWLEGGKKSSATSIELHFNFWSLNSNTKGEINFLDVGVKFSSAQDASSINIFFPFVIDKDKYISRLGRTVCEKDSLISAIFNTNIKEKKPDVVTFDITFHHESENKLRFHSQIELGERGVGATIASVESEDGTGTIISFPISLFRQSSGEQAGESGLPNYFRFRIKMSLEDKKTISQTYKSKDSKLLSRLESTEIVDFRVNEIRNLPPQICSKLENESFISTIHFFLIRETDSEHKLSHTEFKRCRVLEKDLWDDYLRLGDRNLSIPEQMLIYHWKEQKKKKTTTDQESSAPDLYLENFSAFAKFSKTTVSASTIFYFIAIILFLGLVSGFLSGIGASYLYGWLNPTPAGVCCKSGEVKNEGTISK